MGIDIFESVKGFKWFSPINADVVKVEQYTDISKGRIVIVTIEGKPEDLSKFLDWVSKRKEMGKEIEVYRVYLTKIKKHALMVRMHQDMFPVFITLPDLDIYVQREAMVKTKKLRANLRYVLAYSGYKMRYKYTKTKVNRKRMHKHEQAILCIF